MRVYHGSRKIVQTPVFGLGRDDNDYGKGFYCTESLELAKEWACPINENGYANEYELDFSCLKVLNLSSEKYNILNWLALLLKNRSLDLNVNKIIAIQGRNYIINNFLPSTDGFDLIVGYRADDRYFAFARDFVQNEISLSQLSLAMKTGNLGMQIVLKTERAFNCIHFIRYEIADSSIYFNQRKNRETNANTSFNSIKSVISDDDIFVRDLISQKVKNNDIRVR